MTVGVVTNSGINFQEINHEKDNDCISNSMYGAVGCWDSAEQFTDSFVEADNSSMIDKKGNKTDLCQHLAEKYCEKENSSQQEQGTSLSM